MGLIGPMGLMGLIGPIGPMGPMGYYLEVKLAKLLILSVF
jgi:hypothetical protein